MRRLCLPRDQGEAPGGRNPHLPLQPRRRHPREVALRTRTKARILAEIPPGADIFLGLSAGGVLKPEMIKHMVPNPLILTLANSP